MALSELIAAMQQEIHQKEKESELLASIAVLAGYETVEAAKSIYASKKHMYSFDGYLEQLSKLQTILTAGIPSNIAIEAIDSCVDMQEIIRYYKDVKFREQQEQTPAAQ